jgi:Protein of unknown function (DUF2855)
MFDFGIMVQFAGANMTTDFLVNKANLKETRFVTTSAKALLKPTEILLKIEHFAFTSNNVTYASFGDTMNYWNFFPVDQVQEGWGRIPVWGFADVIEIGSAVNDRQAAIESSGVVDTQPLKIGERVYGYFPMSSHLAVTPVQINAMGFSDGAEHRAKLHPVYNLYRRCAADPTYQAAKEPQQMLLQPLFMTAFLIDDFLADNQFFEAEQVILSSASSKTAYSVAHQLKLRKAVKVVGLTSPSNAVFVNAIACYDQVVNYQDIAQLDAKKKTVFVDMAGNAKVRSNIHLHFQASLTYSCSVGGTHWDALAAQGHSQTLPGPKPTLFFAPAQIKKRSSEWGARELQTRMGQAWIKFLPKLDDWMHVVASQGQASVEQVYQAMLEGQSKADQGYVLSLN